MGEVIDLDLARRQRPKKPVQDIDCRIRQEHLAEIVRLRREAHVAMKSLREIQDYVVWLLLDGKPIEEGKLSARVQTVERKPNLVRGATFYRLVVK